MTVVRSPWPVAFFAILGLHLVLNGMDVNGWVGVSKVMLLPLLICWLYSQRGPRLIAIALAFCLLGDLLLIWDEFFTAGMAAFAVAHMCFITFFIAHGAAGRLKRKWWILGSYLVAAIGLVGYLWSGLAADLRPLIPIYAVLLVGTAATSLTIDRTAGIGAGLFLVSDAIIALGEAGRWQPAPSGIWIMALYGLGVFLLTAGILSMAQATPQRAQATPQRK